MVEGIDWTNSSTLEETVILYFESRKTNSSEFKDLLAYFGKKRMAELYRRWLSTQNELNRKDQNHECN